jgi:hypothetical protein
MGLITTGFLFSFFFFPQARASASPLLFIHTFGQDDNGKKINYVCVCLEHNSKKRKEKKKGNHDN